MRLEKKLQVDKLNVSFLFGLFDIQRKHEPNSQPSIGLKSQSSCLCVFKCAIFLPHIDETLCFIVIMILNFSPPV